VTGWWLLVGAGFVNLLAGLVVLFGERHERAVLPAPAPRPVGAGRVLAAGLVVASLSLIEAWLLGPWGPFPVPPLPLAALVGLLWVDLVVVLPVCALELLLRRGRRRGSTLPARAFAWAALLAVPVAVWASVLEPAQLVVEHAHVPLAESRAGTRPLRVGVLADLQATRIGPAERAAVRTLAAQRPDLVLVPGDLFGGSQRALHEEATRLVALLGELDPPLGTWRVRGDNDPPELDTLLADAGVGSLAGASVALSLGDRRITLLGVEDAEGRPVDPALLAAFEQAPGEDDVRLLLVHRPRAVLQLTPGTRVDLVVAGHTHGGQVALPGLGPLVTGSPLPREVAAGGLHELDGRRLYVSRGVGTKAPPAPRIRLGAPPEVSLLVLE